jgi:hypothetical protein
MFADEARIGRMNRPRPCWAPNETRPQVTCQLVREYVYLYGAVSPKDGTCVYLIMPAPDTQCFQIFLQTVAKKYPRQLMLLFVDGAGNHHSDELVVPANIMLHLLPPYSPKLNPQENLRTRFAKTSSRTMPSNLWRRSTQSSKTPPSTSNAIRRSSNPSPCSPTSPTQSDMEVVSAPFCSH